MAKTSYDTIRNNEMNIHIRQINEFEYSLCISWFSYKIRIAFECIVNLETKEKKNCMRMSHIRRPTQKLNYSFFCPVHRQQVRHHIEDGKKTTRKCALLMPRIAGTPSLLTLSQNGKHWIGCVRCIRCRFAMSIRLGCRYWNTFVTYTAPWDHTLFRPCFKQIINMFAFHAPVCNGWVFTQIWNERVKPLISIIANKINTLSMKEVPCVYSSNKIHSHSAFIHGTIYADTRPYMENGTSEPALDSFFLCFLYKNMYSVAGITSFHIEQSTRPHPHIHACLPHEIENLFQHTQFYNYDKIFSTFLIENINLFSFAINSVPFFWAKKVNKKLCVKITETVANEICA